MFMSCPKLKSGATVVRLVVAYRKKDTGTPTNRTVKTIGQSKDPEEIKRFQKIGKGIIEDYKNGKIALPNLSPSPENHINIYDLVGGSRYNKGFEDIFGHIYEKLNFSKLLTKGRNTTNLNEVLKYVVLMHAYESCSKSESSLKLQRYLNKEISLRRILFMMDRVSDSKEDLKKQIFQTLLAGRKHLKLLLFDVTTLYFKSVREDNLQDFEDEKDAKNGEVQIVLAILSDESGMPLSFEVFQENMADSKTLSEVMDPYIKQQSIKKISLVADRSMFLDKNLSYLDSLKEKKDGTRAEYIVRITLNNLPVKIKKDILDFKEKMQTKINNEDILLYSQSQYCELRHKNRRFVISYNESRCVRDRMKREEILKKLNKFVGKEDSIAASSIEMYKDIGRYVKKVSSKKGVSYVVDRNKIAEDYQWDGIYGLCTNRTAKPQAIFKNYRRLCKTEKQFMINEHTLSMHPIYHWKAERIYAHIFICFLTYVLLKYTAIELKKVGISYAPQKILDTLRDVETYVVCDSRKKFSDAYGIARELSKEAEKIYKTFGIQYSTRPYKIS
ncbi:MAG: IS1634 family transposase [Proteobacteria bacterium]|nr:IS1634 family transposase [Pseudomonadota bacterium]